MSCGTVAEIRLHLQDHAVLIELREHDRDLPLPEGVVQGVVDHRGVIPSREAVSRSITTWAWQPRFVLVARPRREVRGSSCRAATNFGAHWFQFVGVGGLPGCTGTASG